MALKSFFNPEKFYPISEDQLIELEPFLEKTKAIIPVFNAFGKAFSPIKSDMNGNIVKLETVIRKKRESGGEYKTIQDILKDEIERKVHKADSSGTVGGIWLGRALNFMCKFFERLVELHQSGDASESISDLIQAAYTDSLKEYHNFVSKTLFKLVSKAAPYKSDLCKKLLLEPPPAETDAKEINDMVIGDMKAYIFGLRSTTDSWNAKCQEIAGAQYKDL